MFSVQKNLFIQENMSESKKEIKFSNKLPVQVNRLVEFYRGKYNLWKSHIYKIKTVK